MNINDFNKGGPFAHVQRAIDEAYYDHQAYLRCQKCAYKGKGCHETIYNCGAFKPATWVGR